MCIEDVGTRGAQFMSFTAPHRVDMELTRSTSRKKTGTDLMYAWDLLYPLIRLMS